MAGAASIEADRLPAQVGGHDLERPLDEPRLDGAERHLHRARQGELSRGPLGLEDDLDGQLGKPRVGERLDESARLGREDVDRLLNVTLEHLGGDAGDGGELVLVARPILFSSAAKTRSRSASRSRSSRRASWSYARDDHSCSRGKWPGTATHAASRMPGSARVWA